MDFFFNVLEESGIQIRAQEIRTTLCPDLENPNYCASTRNIPLSNDTSQIYISQ